MGLRKKYRLNLKNDMPRDKKLLKTLNLDESRSPELNLFSDLEEYSGEEVAKTMAKTMEQYMSKTRADYRSGIARPKIDDKDSFKLKGQFLKELRDNTFSAIQAQLNNLGREINKVNEKVCAAQVGYEQCKGPHHTKDCPLKEDGKILEEAYYTYFGGPFQGGRYRAATLGFYQRNNANPSYQERRQSMEETLIIMEYLVKISKKAHILELKRRHLKITILTSNTPYPSRKIRRICACTSQKTTRKQDPIRRIQRRPIRHIQDIECLRKKYRLSLKNDMLPRDKNLKIAHSPPKLVPSCFAIFDLDLEPLSLFFDFVISSEIFKSLSFSLDRPCHLAILCLDHHAHTLHHLESLLTISLDRLDILKEDLVYQSMRKSLSLILELS
nr:hypothetical protein [Tanacetum cinerariifolium]